MMGKDRDQHDQEQARIAKSEADHFQAIADDMKRDFDATMARLESHSVSLDKLERNEISLSRQISEMPLSSMSPKELADKAQEVATQMRTYFFSYSNEDMNLANDYYDQETSGVTPKEIERLHKEEKTKRADLKRRYESGFKKTVAIADRLRAEMVKRIDPGNRLKEDLTRTAWFEDPDRQTAYTSNENADYLERLATRMLVSSGLQ